METIGVLACLPNSENDFWIFQCQLAVRFTVEFKQENSTRTLSWEPLNTNIYFMLCKSKKVVQDYIQILFQQPHKGAIMIRKKRLYDWRILADATLKNG